MNWLLMALIHIDTSARLDRERGAVDAELEHVNAALFEASRELAAMLLPSEGDNL